VYRTDNLYKSVRARSTSQCQFSNFCFNSWRNVLAGGEEREIVGEGNCWGEYVRGGNVQGECSTLIKSSDAAICPVRLKEFCGREYTGCAELTTPDVTRCLLCGQMFMIAVHTLFPVPANDAASHVDIPLVWHFALIASLYDEPVDNTY